MKKITKLDWYSPIKLLAGLIVVAGVACSLYCGAKGIKTKVIGNLTLPLFGWAVAFAGFVIFMWARNKQIDKMQLQQDEAVKKQMEEDKKKRIALLEQRLNKISKRGYPVIFKKTDGMLTGLVKFNAPKDESAEFNELNTEQLEQNVELVNTKEQVDEVNYLVSESREQIIENTAPQIEEVVNQEKPDVDQVADVAPVNDEHIEDKRGTKEILAEIYKLIAEIENNDALQRDNKTEESVKPEEKIVEQTDVECKEKNAEKKVIEQNLIETQDVLEDKPMFVESPEKAEVKSSAKKTEKQHKKMVDTKKVAKKERIIVAHEKPESHQTPSNIDSNGQTKNPGINSWLDIFIDNVDFTDNIKKKKEK